MTVDSGYIKCAFYGTAEVMSAFRKITESADRQNQFSCGLSWLDDLDCDDEAESENISYDSISCTQEFLANLLKQLPELQFEGTLKHSWPILPCKQTTVTFSADNGVFQWDERCEELALDPDLFGDYDFEEEGEEIVIPLTPYDE